MPVMDVFNQKKEKVSEIQLKDEIFNLPVKKTVLHEVVTMQLANRRAGTASTKGRSEVAGGGRKPWRQKGTGRARAGTNRSPIWRGGGIVFGPKPRDYSYKLPKKVRKLALRMALSSRFQNANILILNRMDIEGPKTRELVSILKHFSLNNALIVTPEAENTLSLSSRNVPGVKVLPSKGLNVYDVLKYDHLVLLEGAIPRIEEALSA